MALGQIPVQYIGRRDTFTDHLYGSGLVFAGITDTCAMGMLLARLPYNRGASCDTEAIVRQFLA